MLKWGSFGMEIGGAVRNISLCTVLFKAPTGFRFNSLSSLMSKSSSSIKMSLTGFGLRNGRLRGIVTFFGPRPRWGWGGFFDVDKSSRASLKDFLAFSAIISRASRILCRFFWMILRRASNWWALPLGVVGVDLFALNDGFLVTLPGPVLDLKITGRNRISITD